MRTSRPHPPALLLLCLRERQSMGDPGLTRLMTYPQAGFSLFKGRYEITQEFVALYGLWLMCIRYFSQTFPANQGGAHPSRGDIIRARLRTGWAYGRGGESKQSRPLRYPQRSKYSSRSLPSATTHRSAPVDDKSGAGGLLPGEIPGILYICMRSL